MEDWKELWSFEFSDAVQEAAAQELQDNGINVPRGELNGTETQAPNSHGAFFGVSLKCGWQPTLSYEYSESVEFQLPRFFVEAVKFLEKHLSREGIFRKAGSVARQKALRATLDSGHPSIPEDANVHDVASLLKQYLRELPEPLITSHILPVFEASYSLLPSPNRQRCILLSCLLLPKANLQCLCVLMKLLHSVSEVAEESLMDASNLAIVLAPNIMRPHIGIITATQGNPLKNQAAIVQLLIENAAMISRVPPEVGVAAKAIQADTLQVTRSLEMVLEDSGTSKDHDLPSRYAGNKDKKQRTSSLSGLVLGLGSRLWSKGGVASESCDNHVTSVKRRTSMKRHGSADDLLCSDTSKRRSTVIDPAPQPHPPLATPDQSHKQKRCNLLSRHRHSGSRRRKASTKSSKFFNFRFTPKVTLTRQGVGVAAAESTSSVTEVLPTQQFVYRGCGVEVEGHTYKSKLLIPSLEGDATPTSFSATNDGGNVHGDRERLGSGKSGDLCELHDSTKEDTKSSRQNCAVRKSGATLLNIDATFSSVPIVGVAQTSSLCSLHPLNSVVAVPAVSHVPSERPSKKIKCDVNWGVDDSTGDGKIRESKSDFSLRGGTCMANSHQQPGVQSPFNVATPQGIPSSKSHPMFPFSQPRPRLEGVRFPFLDAQNDRIEKASFPFTPHARGMSKNQLPDPLNDPIQKASFPFTPFPSLKAVGKTPSPQADCRFSFANPTPLNLHHLAGCSRIANSDTDSLSGEPSIIQNLNRAFVNNSQMEEEVAATQHLSVDGKKATPLLVNDKSCHINSKAALLRRLSSARGKATPNPLEDAFLQTPFLLSTKSPNLIEKITSEIALRHNFSPAPNPNVGLATSQSSEGQDLPNQPLGGSHCPTTEGVAMSDEPTLAVGSSSSQTSMVASEREMFKELVLRVNDSYKKAVEENATGPQLVQSSLGELVNMSAESGAVMPMSGGVAGEGLREKWSSAVNNEDDSCFDNLRPQKLKFDSSNCDSDVSVLSGNEVTASSQQQPTAVGNSLPVSARLGGSHQSVKSPVVNKTWKNQSRTLVTPRSSAKRSMAYSATLGLSEQLLVPRNSAHSRKSTQEFNNAVPLSTIKERGGGGSVKPLQVDKKSIKSTASLSASLGITNLSLGGTSQGCTNSRGSKGEQDNGKKSMQVKDSKTCETRSKCVNDTSSHIGMERTNSTNGVIGGTIGSLDQHKAGEDGIEVNDSPTPALLHILEANGVAGQPRLKTDEESNGRKTGKEKKNESRRMSKSKSTTNIKSYYGNKDSCLKPPAGKIYSSDEPVNYKFKAIGGTVQSDCSIVTRPPSPRLPFGLRSPWFRSSNKGEDIAHGQGIRSTQSGKVTKRVQPYVVSGPIPIPDSDHTSLRRLAKSAHTMSDENNDRGCHGNDHVI